MSLRSKIALVLFVAVSALVSVDRVLYRQSFIGRFLELDEARAIERMELLGSSVEAQLDELAHISNLLWKELLDLDPVEVQPPADPLDLVLTFDSQGKIHKHRLLDPATGKPLTLRELPTGQLSPAHPLQRGWDLENPPRGVWVTERGALLVHGLVLPERGEDPLRLVVGRFLDPQMLAKLRSKSQVRFDVLLARGSTLPADVESVLSRAELAIGPYVEQEDDATLRGWSLIAGLDERPALLLRADSPRDHAPLWQELQRYGITTTLLIVIAFPLVVLLLLQWIVTGPLSRLTSHTTRLGQSNDLEARLGMDRQDEIGQLAAEFDRMVEKLARSREEVVLNARLAGKAEISTGVLHNVGNVLNSLKTAAAISQEVVMKQKVADLELILEALEANAGGLDAYLATDERGQHLLPFLATSIAAFQSDNSRVLGELEELTEGADRIAGLLRALSEFDVRAGVIEQLDLGAQLDSVTELCLSSLESDLEVDIVRDFETLPPLALDRHKLMGILVSLVRNALQAVQMSPRSDKQLILRLVRLDGDFVSIEVTDNGIGIAGEDQVRIFGQGHTTKPGGTGLGLHLAANSATELGGHLTVESAGPGLGASFRLSLPLSAAARAA